MMHFRVHIRIYCKEVNIEPMTAFLRPKTTEMEWPRVKEGGGSDTNKKMLNMQVLGKRRQMRPRERWLDNTGRT